MIRPLICGALCLTAGAGIVFQSKPPTALADRVQPYRTWKCVTPEGVDMDRAMALLCAGPPSWDRGSQNPHVHTVFKVYVNPIGLKAMQSISRDPFPTGSIIVKEKYQVKEPLRVGDSWEPRKLPKEAKPMLLTAMLKREKGYDPKNGDWEYIALSGDAKTNATNTLPNCAKCHLGREKQDFTFRSYPISPPVSQKSKAHP